MAGLVSAQDCLAVLLLYVVLTSQLSAITARNRHSFFGSFIVIVGKVVRSACTLKLRYQPTLEFQGTYC